MEFKDKLKKAMKDNGWNQSHVAHATGRSQGTVSQWLSGKQTPSDKRQEGIAVSLDLPSYYFRIDPDDQNTEFKRLTIEQTARILGVGKETIRLGLQQGVFPWGYAVQTSTGWTYIINGTKLEQIECVKGVIE